MGQSIKANTGDIQSAIFAYSIVRILHFFKYKIVFHITISASARWWIPAEN